jgi:1-acyl-sn-glycerol-3-phosphate acyltransferase
MKLIRNVLAVSYLLFLLLSLYLIYHATKVLKIKDKQAVNLGIMRFFFRILLIICGIKLEIKGLERIKGQKYLIVANHASYIDHLVILMAFPAPFRGTAFSVIFNVPLLGFLLKGIEAIPLERTVIKEKADESFAIVARALEESSVLIYPEGRIPGDGKLLEFRRGTAEIALRSRTPVLPITIIGAANILPPTPHKPMGKGIKFINYLLFWLGNILLSANNGRIKVVIGEPVLMSQEEKVEDFTGRLRNYFIAQLERG